MDEQHALDWPQLQRSKVKPLTDGIFKVVKPALDADPVEDTVYAVLNALGNAAGAIFALFPNDVDPVGILLKAALKASGEMRARAPVANDDEDRANG